eukprot:gene12307-5981_t
MKKKPRISNIEKQKLTSIASRPLIQVKDFQQKFHGLFKAEEEILKPISSNFDISTDDCKIESAYEQIENKIEEQINKIKEPNDNENESYEEKYQINFDSIPSYFEINKKHESTLKSLTEKGKKDNGLMLPRKEMNYITKSMQNKEKSKIFKIIENDEILIHVSFYHSDRNLKVQEYIILGSQKLTELRDCFYCLNDHMISGNEFPSGYFFIENVFYNDLRNKNAIDYSNDIIEWSKSNESFQKISPLPFYKKDMEETTLFDLQLRVGEKYLYCHQGNCKHYIIFNQVRFLNDQDDDNYNSYPLRIFQSKVRRRKCSICEIYSAKWVTYTDKLSPENPSFYCDSCYRQFHYSEKGKLLYDDFEVFRYFHE